MSKVAVVGATGFTGSNVVARLLASGRHEVDAWIHSSAKAWELARLNIPLSRVDITSYREVRAGLAGCDYVVNCSRDGKAVMIDGLKNLLRASRKAGVRRFVNISSVAVYGEPPSPESAREDAEPRAEAGTYGDTKLRQDRLVEAAARNGLPCVTLCPPNITGAGSLSLVLLIDEMRKGTLALVDGGATVVNWVDVRNLAKAVELALSCEQADGRRIFVTDGGETTWADTVEALAPLAEVDLPLPSLTPEEARRHIPSTPRKRYSPVASIKHLISGDVRRVMRKDPIFEKVDLTLRGTVNVLPKSAEDGIRRWLTGPRQVMKRGPEHSYTASWLTTQLRGVRHSCDKAREVLGYEPDHDFADSMRIFAEWFRAVRGLGQPEWSLLRELA